MRYRDFDQILGLNVLQPFITPSRWLSMKEQRRLRQSSQYITVALGSLLVAKSMKSWVYFDANQIPWVQRCLFISSISMNPLPSGSKILKAARRVSGSSGLYSPSLRTLSMQGSNFLQLMFSLGSSSSISGRTWSLTCASDGKCPRYLMTQGTSFFSMKPFFLSQKREKASQILALRYCQSLAFSEKGALGSHSIII